MRTVQRVTGVLAACALALGCQAVLAAPIIVVSPASPVLEVGSTVAVDVTIEGLDGEGVGAFDITIGWDPDVLRFDGATFDLFLDGPADSLQGVSQDVGAVSVFEVSFSDLSRQAGVSAFRLFSLQLSGIAVGETVLGAASIVLSDAFGTSLATRVSDGRVAVVAAPVSVPEPATASLLLLALLGATAASGRYRSRCDAAVRNLHRCVAATRISALAAVR